MKNFYFGKVKTPTKANIGIAAFLNVISLKIGNAQDDLTVKNN